MQFGNSRVDLRNPEHVEKLRRVFRAANEQRMAIDAHLWNGPSYGREDADIGLERVLYGTDSAPPNQPARQGWANFGATVPLTDEELRIIAANAAPYFRDAP